MIEHEAIPVARLELEALRRNAARYLWLRDQSNADASDFLHSFAGPALDDEIDAAIDAGRLAKGFGAALELTKKAVE